MFAQDDLLLLARSTMPFGKFQGRLLIDVPEEYLLWLNQHGMPKGKLGQLLMLALEIKINGLEHLLTPLKGQQHD